MLILKHTLASAISYDFSKRFSKEDCFSEKFSLENLLFFDIETTGLSAEVSSLYLIGCAHYHNKQLQLVQWFADDYQSEIELLHDFFSYIKSFQVLVHYNGNSFDIPYILKKCNQHQLDYNFSNIQSFDLYQRLKPYKHAFSLMNLKQKSMEQFLQIDRKDTYDGKELIHIYGAYLKAKFTRQPEEEDLKQSLLLHNYEDILGLFQISSILSYLDVFEGNTLIQSYNILHMPNLESNVADTVKISFTFSSYLPQMLNVEKNGFQLEIFEHTGIFTIPTFYGELKHFFENYKDYYYLPQEDMAIHKCVASYVDKEFRQKAKPATCYVRKEGHFLMQYPSVLSPCFKENYKSKDSYLLLTREFLFDKETLPIYLTNLIKYLALLS